MANMQEILASYEWLSRHLDDEDLVILDTRPKTAYLYGHIQNSVHLSVEQLIQISEHGAHIAPDKKTASYLLGSIGIDNKKTVIVSGDAMDPSAARIAWTLQYLGHSKTRLLDVSVATWQSMGQKMSRMQTTRTPTQFTPQIIGQLRVEAEELKGLLGKVTILDARSPQEFFAGHIPSATLVPFTDGIGQAGKSFESREYLQAMFEEKGIKKDSEVVCYCMHGHRASSLFYQLQIAGFDNVRLYDGSFIDWYSRRFRLE
jgi:thiosulfate/3-mercaptopyruvate sulfurtransferase